MVVRPVHRLRPWLIGVAYWLALMPLSLAPRHSGNVWSRYMTIESLVERGTFAVERSPLLPISGTPDLIRVGRHFYSDKPPVLSALAAGGYLPIFSTGTRMAGSVAEFVRVNAVLVIGIVGLCSGLTLVALRQLLQVVPIGRGWADLLTLAFGIGSLLLSYGVTFNNHSVAAALVTWAFTLVLCGGPNRPGTGRRRLVTGVLAGLAAVIDLPVGGAVTAALALWLAMRARAVPWPYLAGCAGPLLAHAVLQTLVTGSPLPAELRPELFVYPGSFWTTEAARWPGPARHWRYGLELLVGFQGWLTVTPVLAFGLLGLVLAGVHRGDPLRPASWVVGGVLLALLGYYGWGVGRPDFAGMSYGTRHLLAISPMCYFFAVVALARLRNPVVGLVFALFLAVGGVYAVAGMIDPWSRIERRDDAALRALRPFVIYPRSSYTR